MENGNRTAYYGDPHDRRAHHHHEESSSHRFFLILFFTRQYEYVPVRDIYVVTGIVSVGEWYTLHGWEVALAIIVRDVVS